MTKVTYVGFKSDTFELMIRNIFLLLFLFCYFTSVSGISLNYHFCAGELASVEISLPCDGHKCPCGEEKMDDECCKDEIVYVKLSCDQKASAVRLNIADDKNSNDFNCSSLFQLSTNAIAKPFKGGKRNTPPCQPPHSILHHCCILRI